MLRHIQVREQWFAVNVVGVLGGGVTFFNTRELTLASDLTYAIFVGRGLIKRVYVSSSSGERCYACSHCSKHLIRMQDLHRHIAIHTGERRQACSHCRERFIRKRELQNHIKTHTCRRISGINLFCIDRTLRAARGIVETFFS